MNSRRVKKILVSQPPPKGDKSPYFNIAQKYNVAVEFYPFIKVERVSLKEFRGQHIDILSFTAVVFTARTAIDNFFSLCADLKIMMPDTMMYFCKSEQVALYLQKYIQYRKRKIFFSQTGKIEGLKKDIARHSKEKFLLPVPEERTSEYAEDFLKECKVDFLESIMYRTVSNNFDKFQLSDYDMILFFSPQGIQSLLHNFPDFKQGDRAIGCFGESTAKAVTDAGLRLDCQAPAPEYLSMTSALDAFLAANRIANSQ